MLSLESISLAAMWSPGWPEMVILLVLALIIFGPKRLPQLSRSIGRSIRDFKKGLSDVRDEIEKADLDDEEEEKINQPAKTKAEEKKDETTEA